LGELKQYRPALEAFQKAVALDQKYLKARYNVGVTYDRLRQFKYAEFIYRILIRDFPDFALGYDSLAVSLSNPAPARGSSVSRKGDRPCAQRPFVLLQLFAYLHDGWRYEKGAGAATETSRAGSGDGRAPRRHDRQTPAVEGGNPTVREGALFKIFAPSLTVGFLPHLFS